MTGRRIGVRAEPCVRVVFDQELLLAIYAPSAVVLCRSRRPHHYCAYRQQLADGSLPCWWSGAGPAAVGTVVLPLSVDDPGGAKVTCDSRALVTADRGNGPLRVRSFAGVGAGAGLSTGWPCTHAARRGRRDGYQGHRRLHRHRRW